MRIYALVSLFIIFKFNHLNEEVKHIAGPNLKEAGFTEKEIGDMIDRLIKYAQNHGDPFLILPFMTRYGFSLKRFVKEE